MVLSVAKGCPAWVVLTASVATACRPSAQDSSQQAPFGRLAAWSADSVPLASIGVAMGDPAQEFAFIWDVVALADGTIVVADDGASKLRAFGASGAPMYEVGRRGEGPGEFLHLNGLVAVGDTVVVYDGGNNRLTWFGPGGALLGTARVRAGYRVRLPLPGALEGRALLVVEDRYPSRLGLFRFTARLALVGMDGMDTVLLSLPGSEKWVARSGNGMIGYGAERWHRRAAAVAWGSGFFAASTDSPVVRRYAVDGSSMGEIRWAQEVVPFDGSAVSAVLAEFARERPNLVDVTRDRLNAETLPASLPAFDALRLDSEGNLWVRPFAVVNVGRTEWLVFDSDGVPVARARIPLGTRWIGRDRVIVKEEDGEGVQRVRVYRLCKPISTMQ